MDQSSTNEEMGRGFERLTDYTQCDSSAIDSLYLLITESLPHLVERKEERKVVHRQVTFSINGFDPNLRGPWWENDD